MRAIFGWATLALFGEVREGDRTLLSVAVGAAAAWPALVIGTFFPRPAALLLALLPIPHAVPERVLRIAWIASAAAVPLLVGGLFARRAGRMSPRERVRRLLLGFPATLGIAGAFWFACVAVPIGKLSALLAGRKEEHVPLAIPPDDYVETARALRDTLARGGFALEPATAPWTMRVLGRILNTFSKTVLDSYVSDEILSFRSGTMEVTVYPNGVRILGGEKPSARVHALISEGATATAALQCTTPEGQKLERRVQQAWRRHARAAGVDAEVTKLAADLAECALPFEDWQVLFREILQVVVASRGASHLLERSVREDRKGSGPAVRRSRNGRPHPARRAVSGSSRARVESRPGDRSPAKSP